MSEASLAAQKYLRTLFTGRAALTALVPSANIFDRNSRPEVFPCILLGDGQFVADDAGCIQAGDVYMALHVWTAENGFAACKSIVGEIRRAVRDAEDVVDGFALSSTFQDATYLRDPDGEHSHGVVTIHLLAEDTLAGVV
ncbi:MULTISPECIES: DUF3168 domain-containing protein [unclassified Mesorhizobium]|uniref:DUF3168 domain-containing protein n=1 Tax=unclassified Mesorhizobium TaxID=325217 RepID=UPI0011281443|nr:MULTISPECIES: DUF3168 domain-containing protein [unclassified Mesorhizobium]TPJ36031.1 DUF3168 domain-containing protein [Mesorhizobium sp. B2-6-6]MBZ9999635.1 DUF3168 domain-containing protein [Mesorhizobium sp. B264B2A]MCA0008109.1 DUF3168 domain-containing protein [Mesorhizobium sp. B264B1B]MCA0018017.1 DUF3168 domain-containing protein [Mesorhizobium sp. B264B1A]TPJ53173.1 DUF3168 domain-containing protein [Mesorhizobium sp. B2-6-7]